MADADKTEGNEGPLAVTEKSVAKFALEKTQENYVQAVDDFVFEVMATQRHAWFPVNPHALGAQLKGQEPLATGIVRDSHGLPFLVFLTSSDVSSGTFDASVKMVASAVLIKVLQDESLAGVAINPWTNGGLMVASPILLSAVAKIDRQLSAVAADESGGNTSD